MTIKFAKSAASKLAIPLFAATALGAAGQALAQDFPNKPIRMVIPVAAGNSSDVLAREIINKIKDRAGWTMVADNRAGADFAPGILAVTQSPPDGYTIMQGYLSFAILPSMRKSLAWNVNDLATVARVGLSPAMIAMNVAVPANTLPELIAYSKANPGKLNLGGATIGSTGHLAAEMIRIQTGLDFTYVPYKNASATIPDVVSGRLQLAYTGIADMVDFFRTNKMKPLVVLGPKRNPLVPNVPTALEVTNNPELDIGSWYGFFVRTGTPQPIIARLEKEILGAAETPEVRAYMNKAGQEPLSPMEGAEAFRKRFDADIARWARVIKQANIPQE